MDFFSMGTRCKGQKRKSKFLTLKLGTFGLTFRGFGCGTTYLLVARIPIVIICCYYICRVWIRESSVFRSTIKTLAFTPQLSNVPESAVVLFLTFAACHALEDNRTVPRCVFKSASPRVTLHHCSMETWLGGWAPNESAKGSPVRRFIITTQGGLIGNHSWLMFSKQPKGSMVCMEFL